MTAAASGPEDATSARFSIIDGFGLTQLCTNVEDGTPSRICNCGGPLPEYGWGQKIRNRDPCGIDKKSDDKAWIAAPVIGGLAFLLALCALGFYLLKRRDGRSHQREGTGQASARDIQLSFLSAIKTNSQKLAGRLSHRRNAGWDASTPSQTSLESGDSGASLV